jgi:hypothetical protein
VFKNSIASIGFIISNRSGEVKSRRQAAAELLLYRHTSKDKLCGRENRKLPGFGSTTFYFHLG